MIQGNSKMAITPEITTVKRCTAELHQHLTHRSYSYCDDGKKTASTATKKKKKKRKKDRVQEDFHEKNRTITILIVMSPIIHHTGREGRGGALKIHRHPYCNSLTLPAALGNQLSVVTRFNNPWALLRSRNPRHIHLENDKHKRGRGSIRTSLLLKIFLYR